MFNYAEVFGRLNFETAIIVFLKKNGDVRIMLGTRNMGTILLDNPDSRGMAGRDGRCTIDNGNIAVYDLIIDEPRVFNISRLVSIDFLGSIDTTSKMDEIVEKFSQFKEGYELTSPMTLSMEMLD